MRIPGGDVHRYTYGRHETDGDKITKMVDRGLQFCLAKATQRANFVDPTWRHHRQQLIQNETRAVKGAFFAMEKGHGRDQVNFFLDTIKDPNGWLCAADVEKFAGQRKETVVDYDTVLDANDEWVKNVPGHPLIIYTGGWFWAGSKTSNGKSTTYLGNPPHPAGTLLWDADYSTGRLNLYDDPAHAKDWATNAHKINFHKTYGNWPYATIRQFGSLGITGKKNGDLHMADGDAFAGEQNALRLLTGNNGTDPGGCPVGYHKDNSGVCVPDTADCPTGFHKNDLGICVPDSGGDDGTDEPWDGTNDPSNTIAYNAGVNAGTGGGLILAGVAAAVLATVYVAYKSGSKHEPVIDRGDKE